MTKLRLPVLTAIAVASSVAWTSPTLSQDTKQTQPPQQQQAAPISEGQLKSYAVAAAEVQRISASFQPRIRAADTPADRQQVQQEALDQMADAVRANGFSVQQYNQITQRVQADPQLSRRLQNYLGNEQ